MKGRSITYKYGDSVNEGIVVGHDPDLGITIINANDPDDYLICINGPASKMWKELNTHDSEIPGYKRVFNYVTERIKAGLIVLDDLSEDMAKQASRPQGHNPSSESCAFS